MLLSLLVYAGSLIALIGLIGRFKHLPFLGITTRLRAVIVLVIGVLMAVTGFSFPAHETRVEQPRSALDRFAPVYQFNEVHSINIKASPTAIQAAINEVTADEIALFRPLTWIRRAGRNGGESILNPTPGVPILTVATRTGFTLLAQDPEHELVFGAPVLAPRSLRLTHKLQPDEFIQTKTPGFAFAIMNFEINDLGDRECSVTTETRVFATNPATVRKFTRYWRIVYPGSSLIRYSWLRAIKRRAEAK